MQAKQQRRPHGLLDHHEDVTDNSPLPAVSDPGLVGSYPARAQAGGGFVWDAVLEYRVWCHPERGAPDASDGSDYFRAFATYEDALEFAEATPGAEEPLALILQEEYIEEPEPGTTCTTRKHA